MLYMSGDVGGWMVWGDKLTPRNAAVGWAMRGWKSNYGPILLLYGLMSLLHLETEENPRNDYEKPDWILLCLAHFHSPGSRRRFLERVICLSLLQAAVTLSRKWLLDMFTLDTIWHWYMVLTQITGLIWNEPHYSIKSVIVVNQTPFLKICPIDFVTENSSGNKLAELAFEKAWAVWISFV